MSNIHEVIIIGSGPAGLTAAIYTARAELKPLIIGGTSFGGQLMTTTEVENYPGFPEGVMGPKLMMDMIEQAKKYGTEINQEMVTKVDFSGDIKKISTNQTEYKAKRIILATGSSPKTLNIPGEQEFWGKGVSVCATCDGAFYKDKVVAVVGGGDTAMEEASFLSKFASKLYLIHRKDEFRASKVMQERVLNNPKIEVIWNTEVKEVLGDQKVNAMKTVNNKTSKESITDIDGFFLAIGHKPNTTFLGDAIELDDNGYIKVIGNTKTSVKGVYVAGDVRDHTYQQAITAAGMGCMAAMDVERSLLDN